MGAVGRLTSRSLLELVRTKLSGGAAIKPIPTGCPPGGVFGKTGQIGAIPAVFGAMLILAALFGQVSIPKLTTQAEMHEAAGAFQVVVGAMFYVVMSVYATWYLLDCLYADRRDRSILFWKSLPISDAKTVLIK